MMNTTELLGKWVRVRGQWLLRTETSFIPNTNSLRGKKKNLHIVFVLWRSTILLADFFLMSNARVQIIMNKQKVTKKHRDLPIRRSSILR